MDFKNIELTYIVPVFNNINNKSELENLINTYSKYDFKVLNKIHFIFVDDCSPNPININTQKLNYTLVRVLDNINWNQGGARNLGASLAKTPKLILTDIDHIFTESILKDLLLKKVRDISNKIYLFRRQRNGKRINSHPNTFFCTKSTFYKSLGVDEEFCGNYGYEDIYFIELQKFIGTKFRKYRKHMVSVHEHSQHNLIRDTQVNSELLKRKLIAIKEKNPFSEHSRKFICFKWEEVKSNWLV